MPTNLSLWVDENDLMVKTLILKNCHFGEIFVPTAPKVVEVTTSGWGAANAGHFVKNSFPFHWMSKDLWYVCFVSAGFLFINRTEVLPQDLVKFRGWEIRFYIFPISLKFDRHASEFLAVTRVTTYIVCNVCIVYKYVFDCVNGKSYCSSDRVMMRIYNV